VTGRGSPRPNREPLGCGIVNLAFVNFGEEAGWAGKQNGELLQLAENKFDALITLYTNLRYQQNLTQRKIAIVMIRAHSNRLADLSQHFPACAQALEKTSLESSSKLAARIGTNPVA
jgi:hypothetical protein